MNILRYLQGERRGMGSELKKPPENLVALAQLIRPSITIQTQVRLADVSFWQETIDFEVMKAAGARGVIIRAGQRYWEDSKFRTNWAKAKAAGLPRGTYWFYDSRETPRKQAEIWAGLIDGDRGELVHAADFEENYGGQYKEPGHFKEFLNRFQDLTGLPDDRVANYTGHFWWMDRVGNDIFFRRYPLWLAWYGEMSVVRVPAPWSERDLLLWQYTGSGNGTAYGVSSLEIDLNYFSGDVIDYERRFSLGSEPPPQPEDPMRYTATALSDGTRLRSSHDTTLTPVGSYPRGTEFHGELIWEPSVDVWREVNGVRQMTNKAGDRWLSVSEIGGLTRVGWVAIKHMGLEICSLRDNAPPTTPPEEGDPDWLVAHWIGGRTRTYRPE